MRKLASIQVISKLEPIDGADFIELAKVLGWDVVVKKGEFQVGDKCVYCEIDSIMPSDNPSFDFLKDKHGIMKPIKTKKMKGRISQGVCFPMSIIDGEYEVGTDVTEIIGIKKYEPDENNVESSKIVKTRKHHSKLISFLYRWGNRPKFLDRFLFEQTKKPFPSFINRTDETRVQVMQGLLDKYKGIDFTITEKLDGSSITIWFDSRCHMHVASRNYELLDKNDPFWVTVKALNIEGKLKEAFSKDRLKDIALQGEIIGPNIQGNRYNLKSKEIYFYNLYHYDTKKYDPTWMLEFVCDKAGINCVPVLDYRFKLTNEINSLIDRSLGMSKLNQTVREGIVLRPYNVINDNSIKGCVGNRVSFKVINPTYLLKHNL